MRCLNHWGDVVWDAEQVKSLIFWHEGRPHPEEEWEAQALSKRERRALVQGVRSCILAWSKRDKMSWRKKMRERATFIQTVLIITGSLQQTWSSDATFATIWGTHTKDAFLRVLRRNPDESAPYLPFLRGSQDSKATLPSWLELLTLSIIPLQLIYSF